MSSPAPSALGREASLESLPHSQTTLHLVCQLVSPQEVIAVNLPVIDEMLVTSTGLCQCIKISNQFLDTNYNYLYYYTLLQEHTMTSSPTAMMTMSSFACISCQNSVESVHSNVMCLEASKDNMTSDHKWYSIVLLAVKFTVFAHLLKHFLEYHKLGYFHNIAPLKNTTCKVAVDH